MVHSKYSGDTITFTFDFTGVVDGIGSATVTAVHDRGTPDAGAGSLILGNPLIDGARVRQRITGGLDGALYVLTCTALGTDGERLSDQALLWVRSRDV